MIGILEDPMIDVLGAVSIAMIAHLWLYRGGRPGQKLFWSLVLLAPLLGPLFYLALYVPPSVQPEHMRAREHPDPWAAEYHHDGLDHHDSMGHHD